MVSVGVGSPGGKGGPVVVGRLNAKPLDLGQVGSPTDPQAPGLFQGEGNDPFPRANSYFGVWVPGTLALSAELLQSRC